jgi:hypothetical protein
MRGWIRVCGQVAKTVYAEQICALDIFTDFEMPEAVIGDLSAELELAPYGPNEQLIQVCAQTRRNDSWHTSTSNICPLTY